MPQTSDYKQGYLDGWLAAIEGMAGLLDDSSPSKAYETCASHWETELANWQRDNTQGEPPDLWE